MKARLYDPESNREYTGDITRDVVDRSVLDWGWRRQIISILAQILRRPRCRCNVVRWEGVVGLQAPVGWFPITFGTEIVRGLRAEVGAGGWRMIAEEPGVYHVSVAIGAILNFPVTLTGVRIALWVNGAWYSHLDTDYRAGITEFFLAGSDHVMLRCGDVLQVYIHPGTAGGLTTPAVAQQYGYVGMHLECCADVMDKTTDTLDGEYS